MITILRLNHRSKRDKRVSTHVGLVSRAFGATDLVYSGEKDEVLEDSIKKVVKRWGGSFKINYSKDFIKTIKLYKKKGFIIIHLTMYGLELDKTVKNIDSKKNLLIVVGGEKVPREVYDLSDFNLSITNQPHSEIAALALTLDRLKKGEEFNIDFKNANLKIKPSNGSKEFY